jgi:N-acylneuraminate cytidylyltransferase
MEPPARVSTVALIPARGGSKGIPRKNIRPLAGRPLIYWTCRAAQDCPQIDTVYVSTDDAEIEAAVRGLNLSKVQPIARAPETATDTASTESVLLDFAQRLDFDRIVLIQATSPLLRAADLDAGCELLHRGFDSVLSVVRQKRFLWERHAERGGVPINYDYRSRPRRQDFDGQLVENGAFYITTRERLLAERCRIGGKIGLVEMPEETYIELDDLHDWHIVEALLIARGQS